ncbi:alcohol dehydrogenase [Colletotrichum filicis]|nr:alcohol dehydrogenase [Colletotrichum filicis]
MQQKRKILVIGSPRDVIPDKVWAEFSSRYETLMYDYPKVQDFYQSMTSGTCKSIDGIMRIGINTPPDNEKLGMGWTRRALPYLPSTLKMIVNFGHGFDEEDVSGLNARGIDFFNTTGGSEATAVVAVYLIISVFRQLNRYERMLRDEQFWPALRHSSQNAVDPFGKKIGIIGMGSIGQTVARQAAALGMEVHCIDRPNLRRTLEVMKHENDHVKGLLPPILFHKDLVGLVASVDCLVLACSYSPTTHHLLSKDVFSGMKKGIRIVNVARGRCIDEEALCDAIDSGTVAAAGLDVHYNEPNVNPRLLNHDCVTLLPHLGGLTHDSMKNHALMALKSVDDFFACSNLT